MRLELARIAFFDPRGLFDARGQFIDITKLSAETAAAISSIEITTNEDGERVTKVRLCGKVEALDKLCRHLGMYEDKVRTCGLERELATLSDEEIERRLIELGRGEYRRIDNAGGSGPAAREVARDPSQRNLNKLPEKAC